MLRSDPRIHYKMYKAKKNMVYAALFSFAVLGGLSLNQNAKADTVENNNGTPEVQTVANSAQSTTGATPQSMPTQSAVPTQSPTAALNTNNSAPTAQPVSAQPVVNSQDDSASNAASQNQTTTLNIQSAQPAQRFAVTKQANLYAQNLAQNINEQVAVSNVNVDYTVEGKTMTHKPGEPWYLTVHTEFDLDTNRAQLNTPIVLGHLSQTSDTNGKMAITMPTTQQPVFYHQQKIGYLTYDDIYPDRNKDINNNHYKFVMTAKPNAVGTIHLVTNTPSAIFVNQDASNWFRGIPLSHNTFGFVNNNGKATTNLNFTIQQKDDYTRYDTEGLNWIKSAVQNLENHYFGFANTTGSGQSNVIITIPYPELDPNEVAETFHGNNLTKPISLQDKTYTVGGHIYLENGGTILNDQPAYTGPMASYGITGTNTWSVDSQGRYVDYWTSVGVKPYLNQQATIQNIVAPAGSTLQQMKAQIDPTKNMIIIAQQNDGSLLYVVNLTPDFFKGTGTINDALNDANTFAQVNADSDPDKAAQNSANALLNIFHGMPAQLGIWRQIQIADPTIANELRSDTIDLDTGKVINTDGAKFMPNTYMAHGQAAVKLHVINATNGTELNQWSKLTNKA